jgi:hypothetical protein
VTIDGDELLLLVPQYESGVARIALDALDAEERVRVPGNGTFTTPSSNGGRDRDRPRSSRETERSNRSPDSTESMTADTSPPSTAGASEADPSPARGSDRNRSNEASEDRNRSGESPNDQNRRSSSTTERERTASSRSEDGPSISATRRAPERAPGVGHAVRDRIAVENEGGPVESVEVALDDDARVALGRLDGGETASVDRFVAAGENAELTLPSAAVEADESVVGEVDAERLPVNDDSVGVVATVDPTDGTLTATFENGTDRRCRVTGVDPGPDGGRASLSAAVDAGASASVSTAVDERPAPGDAVPVSFWVESDGKERRIDVLAAADDDAGVGGTAGGSARDEPSLRPGISPDTQVAGEYSSVVLAFENDGGAPLADVSVVADGDPIDSMFYSPARRELVEPGDRIEHYVDLESGHAEPSFEVTVSYAVDGTEREYVARASGPAVDDEAAWTDDHLNAWSLDRVGAATVSPDVPSQLSTPLRSED